MTDYSAKEMAYREKLISEIEDLLNEISNMKEETPRPKLSLVREE